ncbi:hypothetical protein [Bacillus sp. CGMCC 1.16541]|nr:hypothetical protein [Bacillus sp. CGMCC 1.16541]
MEEKNHKKKQSIELMMDTALNPDMMMYLERKAHVDPIADQMGDQQANG